ncbi:GntR family transcriptional regulator [Psychrobacillus sp. L3]|uniref:GntR family transcriptional regulator n=1 Tax=Psychrobacillus sp. L3 TaxID=3236891 RepID=UPI0036F37F1C
MFENQNLSDHVVTLIRKMILNGTLKPGERINQAQLAEKLQISRGPIREALRLLQNEGLIKYELNKGTYITTLSNEDAYEIYTLRGLLEGKAAQLALKNIQVQDFDRLQEIMEGFEKSFIENDLESQAQYDILFHQTVVRASKHNRLIHMHQQLDTQVGAMFFTVASIAPVRAKHVVENHQKLIDALKSGNEEYVQKEFSEHYNNTLLDLLKNN